MTVAWKVINICIFGKPTSHTPTVPSFKFLWTVVSEKIATLMFLDIFPTIIAPYDLWPLREDIKLSIFGKPLSHTTSMASLKFLCLTVSEKKAMFKFLGLFPQRLLPLTFARGNKTTHVWKALTAYYHQATFQDSVINSLWEKSNVKVLVHADAG